MGHIEKYKMCNNYTYFQKKMQLNLHMIIIVSEMFESDPTW